MGGILWVAYFIQRQVGGDDQRLLAAVGQILRQWHIGFQVIRNDIHLHFYIRISARPFESFGFHHCSDDLLPSEDTDWHGR